MPTKQPTAPLPPELTSDEPGSWAYDTMSRRVRTDILARVFRENSFSSEIVEKLKQLDQELANAGSTQLTYLAPDGGPDIETWNHEILPPFLRKGVTWLSAPWMLAEFYFLTFHPFVQPTALRVMCLRYRRIMSAINYFDINVDPFELQKELGLTSAVESIATLSVRVNDLFSGDSGASSVRRVTQLQTFVLTALWGNRMDLSIWPVGGSGDSEGSRERASEAFSSVLEAGQKMILSNHMDDLTGYVQSLSKASRMDIIVDNAGFELYCDLCLADFLIFSGLANCVYLQLKAHPTFVSDAMGKDVMHTIHFLQNTKREGGTSTPQSVLGSRWLSHIEKGNWILSENFFWAQPQPMWDIPDGLRRELATSSLVFVKGDANYRRLLGDRHWDFATSFQDVVSYFPAPICALRTLKAELGCGMAQEETTRAENEDPNWLVAGKFGVVQFCDTRKL